MYLLFKCWGYERVDLYLCFPYTSSWRAHRQHCFFSDAIKYFLLLFCCFISVFCDIRVLRNVWRFSMTPVTDVKSYLVVRSSYFVTLLSFTCQYLVVRIIFFPCLTLFLWCLFDCYFHTLFHKTAWRKLHNEELHDLYSSPNIVWVIKSRRMRWGEHLARMGEGRGVYRVLVGKPEGKRPLGRPRPR
jgi:hypothetical protein